MPAPLALVRRAERLRETMNLAPEELDLEGPRRGRVETYDVGDGTELSFVFTDAEQGGPEEAFLTVYGYQRMGEEHTIRFDSAEAARLYGLAVVTS